VGWHDVRNGNPVKDALARGETVVGSFIRVPSPEIAEMCGHAFCDFVIVDTEHTPVGWERVASIITAAENVGTSPILRVSNSSRDLVSRGLDAGAHGIMIPQIESPEMARSAVAATRYGPGGTRGTAGNTRSGFGMKIPYSEYVDAANEAMLTVIQVESANAVAAVDEIAEVDGIDCLFIGLTDLSVDLGHPGDYMHPAVDEQVTRVLASAARLGVPTGVPVSNPEMARSYMDRGVQFVATSDTGLFAKAVRNFVEGVRESTG
jgi:2-keto-3-deoxy-L-rhamnonate aldolase RhmA